jgi:hypothetical protein
MDATTVSTAADIHTLEARLAALRAEDECLDEEEQRLKNRITALRAVVRPAGPGSSAARVFGLAFLTGLAIGWMAGKLLGG